ncbi:hypothetical protein V5O48_017517 [Marasmius crinis-equi]|uniref:Uncharacterized protein n=1 Tax=Marasmius crinis-equi TaxID=585013 RepID=A0ABR3ENR1_9AGAR
MNSKTALRFPSIPLLSSKHPQVHPQPVRVARFPTSSGASINPNKISVACAGYELIQLLSQAAASSANSAAHHQAVFSAIRDFLDGPSSVEPISAQLSEIHDTQVADFCNHDRYAGLQCHSLGAVWELDSKSLHPQEVGMVPVLGIIRGVLIAPTIQRGQWLYILGQSQDPKLPFYAKVPYSKRADYWPEVYNPHLIEANRISPVLVGVPSQDLTLEGMMKRAARCYEGPDGLRKRKWLPRSTEETLEKLCGDERYEETFIPWPGSSVLSEGLQLGDWLEEHLIPQLPSPLQPVAALSFPLPQHWTNLDAPKPPSDFPGLLSIAPDSSSPELPRKDQRKVSKAKSEIGLREALQIMPPPEIFTSIPSASSSTSPSTKVTCASGRFSTSTTATEVVEEKKSTGWKFIKRVRALSMPGKKDKGKRAAPPILPEVPR